MCLDVVFCLEFVKVLDLWLSGIPKLPPRFGNLLERHAELSVQKQNHHSSRVFLRGVTQGMLYCSSSEFWQHMCTGVYQRGSSVTLSPGFLLRGAVCLACARISDFRNKMGIQHKPHIWDRWGTGSHCYHLGHGGLMLISFRSWWAHPDIQVSSQRLARTSLANKDLSGHLSQVCWVNSLPCKWAQSFHHIWRVFCLYSALYSSFWFPFSFPSVTAIICVLIRLLDFMSWFIDVVPIFSHISFWAVFIAISSLIFFSIMSNLLLILSSAFAISESLIWVILHCPCLSLTQSYVYQYFQHSLFIIAVLMAFSVNLSSVSFLCLFCWLILLFILSCIFLLLYLPGNFLSVYQIFWILCCWVLDF